MWAVRVAGVPVAKPDPKCFGTGGMHRLAIPKGNSGYAAWRTRCLAAGEALHGHIGETLDGPVSVEVVFTVPRPKSAPASRLWPAVRIGDLDKMCRALLDAFTDARVWGDDSQVVQLASEKTYPSTDEPGALIRVWRTPDHVDL